MAFTFYGDLLGISSAYQLSPEAAYDKLDRFYNLCFRHLKSACQGDHAKVNMFSDSILFWGDNPRLACQLLKQLYVELVTEGILLRGAIVQGELQFDPRFTVENFDKSLPRGNVLPRAVGLASSCKGARLIVDREIAHTQLPGVEWHTVEGYLQSQNAYPAIPQFDSRRFICPVPQGTHYELLYFYPVSHGIPPDAESVIRHLRTAGKMTSKEIAEHYTETINVIERSQLRIQT